MRISTLKLAKYFLLIIITAIVIVPLVNLNDEKFKEIPDLSGANDYVDKPDNAYYAFVGFNSLPGENMHVMGYKIIQNFAQYTQDKDDSAFNLEQVDKASGLDFEGDTDVLCKSFQSRQCFNEIIKNKQAILALKQKNIHLYNRYRALLGYSKYKEDSFYITSWSDILNLYRLHMNLIALKWLEGNKNRAIALLAESIRFNRTFFDNGGLLINKMVASTLYKNSLENYAVLSKSCKGNECDKFDRIIIAMKGLNKNDICLRDSFYSELRYFKRTLNKLKQSDKTSVSTLSENDSVLLRLGNRYFLQPAATFNSVFDSYSILLKACKLNTHEVVPYLKSNETEKDYSFPWYSYIYNPFGKRLLKKNNNVSIGLNSYVYVMLDLEAYQRLLKLQTLIYRKNIKFNSVASFLEAQTNLLKNPYTNTTFKFSELDAAISYVDHQSRTVSVFLRNQ